MYLLIVVVCAGQFRETVLGLHIDVTVTMRSQLKAIVLLRKIPLFYIALQKNVLTIVL